MPILRSRAAPASWTVVRPAAVRSSEMCVIPFLPRSRDLLRRKFLALANLFENLPSQFGDPTGQLSALVTEESPVLGIASLPRDAGELERLAVVPARVSAAVVHRDRMIRGATSSRCLRWRGTSSLVSSNMNAVTQ